MTLAEMESVIKADLEKRDKEKQDKYQEPLDSQKEKGKQSVACTTLVLMLLKIFLVVYIFSELVFSLQRWLQLHYYKSIASVHSVTAYYRTCGF